MSKACGEYYKQNEILEEDTIFRHMYKNDGRFVILPKGSKVTAIYRYDVGWGEYLHGPYYSKEEMIIAVRAMIDKYGDQTAGDAFIESHIKEFIPRFYSSGMCVHKFIKAYTCADPHGKLGMVISDFVDLAEKYNNIETETIKDN